jgi:2-polyprenyl-6-methoxyphenol hydroxylase-like FAD-dependent oxidoreductase
MRLEIIDVLIVGGGPAGLLAAAQLSKKHRVTLIERGLLGQTMKFWGTTERRLKKHGLQDFVSHRPVRMAVGTFLGGELSFTGDFAVVDDTRFLDELLTRCRLGGVDLIEQCELLNLHWTDEFVQVQTTKVNFLSRLVADATGGNSLIASTFRLHRIDGFYAVYGALLEDIKLNVADIVLGYVGFLGNPMPVFELIPTGIDSAYCVVFVCGKSLPAPDVLTAAFERYCKHNPFFEMRPGTRQTSVKAGAIPIGRMRRKRLPGLVSLGEAALIQPPLMGTAFNAVLDYSDSVSDQISMALSGSSGLAKVPRRVYPLLKEVQDRLQLVVARELIHGNVEVFDATVRMLSRFPQHLLFNFFSNELSLMEVVQMTAQLPANFLFRSVLVSALRRGSPH